MNWVRFGLTGTYGIIVFIFFFAYITGVFSTANVANDVLYVGFIIMLGIVLNMAGSTSESKSA